MPALIIIAAIVGIAAAWAPLALGSGALRLIPIASADLGIQLAEPIMTPAAIQDRGMMTLSGMNHLLTGGLLVVVVCTLTVFAFVRASGRAPEIHIHRAVGASRKRLVIAGAYESALLALPAALAGSLLGLLVLNYAIGTWPGTVYWEGLRVPLWLPAAVALTIVLGILLPLRSIGAMRPSVPPLGPLIAPAVCAIQLAVCFTVLVHARHVSQHANTLLGAVASESESGTVFELELSASPLERSRQLEALIERSGLSGLFDVASISSPGALKGIGTVTVGITECGACSQGGIATPLRPVAVSLSVVSADTFRALNLRLVEGRLIADRDDWQAGRVAVITQGLARAHFEGGQALGRHIQIGQGGGAGNRFRVVGVVNERQAQSLGGGLQPADAVYASALQLPPSSVEFLVRSASRFAWRSVLPWFPAGSVQRVVAERQWRADRAAPVRWFGAALFFTAASVVVIALFGIGISITMWVSGMLPELAVRRCVGARRGDVLTYLAYRGAGVVLAGVMLGLVLVELTAVPLSSLVSGIPPFDAAGVLQTALVLVVVTGLGMSVPAWRASRAAPVVLLRLAKA